MGEPNRTGHLFARETRGRLERRAAIRSISAGAEPQACGTLKGAARSSWVPLQS